MIRLDKLPTWQRQDLSLVYLPQGDTDLRIYTELHAMFGAARVRQLMWFNQQLAHEARDDYNAFAHFVQSATGILIGSADKQRALGCVWFKDITPQRASISVCYVPGVPPDLAVRGTLSAAILGASVHHFDDIWSQTPWRAAVRHARTCGSQLIATLPGFVEVSGRFLPLHILQGTISHATELLRHLDLHQSA